MKYTLKFILYIMLLATFMAEAAGKGQGFDPATTPMNTFRFLGNALVCISDNLEDVKHGCYRFGSLKIGDSVTPREKPWKEVPRKNGVIDQVFPIIANEKHNAYWVIGIKDKKVVSIQLTGNYAHEKLSFSTIMLGDKKQKVKKILGPNYTVKRVDSINGVMWDYYPFAITIEFIKGKVYSIRIAEEASNK